MKIRQLEAELLYAGGRTDGRDEVKSRFSQFCEKRIKTVRQHVCMFMISTSGKALQHTTHKEHSAVETINIPS